MKYKVGDKVRIKSLDWYNENKNKYGEISVGNGEYNKCMKDYCEKVMTIHRIVDNKWYMMKETYIYAPWTDEMIEGLVEEDVDLIPKFGEFSDNEPLDIPTMTTDFVKEHGLPCPEGYQFVDENGNIINTTKIVLEKKKKEYPKTYEECCKIMGIDTGFLLTSYDLDFWKGHLLTSLQKLLICRDTYWKIAGEEMGLGKPWEPDWTDDNAKYSIYTIKGALTKAISCYDGAILAFPTEEMRDVFYENFKEVINECKELL